LEPDAVTPHVRICAGRRPKGRALPRPDKIDFGWSASLSASRQSAFDSSKFGCGTDAMILLQFSDFTYSISGRILQSLILSSHTRILCEGSCSKLRFSKSWGPFRYRFTTHVSSRRTQSPPL
jgi:hypothetical protein